MARQVYTYLIIGIGMLLFLRMGGIEVAGTDMLEWIGIDGLTITENITISNFYLAIAAVFASALTGVFVGFLRNVSVESFIVGSLAGTLFAALVPVFVGVTRLALNEGDWTGSLVLLIMIPYMAGLGIALINWWRGSD